MAEDKNRQQGQLSEEAAQNIGARTAAIHENPQILDEEARNANAGETPNAAGGASKPSDTEAHVPSSSSPQATDLPTSNAPHPEDANPKNPDSTR